MCRAMDNGIHDNLLSSKGNEVGDLKERIYEESKKIWWIALPVIIARVSSFGALIVTQSFIGHISSVDLAAYVLVQTLTVRFVNGILIGMSSATETLCGQAYGAKQYHMMGIYLQRSWIVNLITSTLLMPLFIYGGAIFRLLGEEPEIASASGYISWWFIPMVYNYVFTLTIQMYLQAQQKNIVVAWISVVQITAHVLLSWLFVNRFSWGIPGAMGALNISSVVVSFAELVYILGGCCPETWTGFSTAAFKDLLPVIKLLVSSGVMVWYISRDSSIFLL